MHLKQKKKSQNLNFFHFRHKKFNEAENNKMKMSAVLIVSKEEDGARTVIKLAHIYSKKVECRRASLLNLDASNQQLGTHNYKIICNLIFMI